MGIHRTETSPDAPLALTLALHDTPVPTCPEEGWLQAAGRGMDVP